MVVQHNISAMNANRYYGINNSGLSKSLEKLSSGYKINRAGDDAAGLAVSEKMRSQIGGLTQGVKNAQDGISMIQTFEGALTETDSILQRMKTLADQAANGTYQDDVDRDAIQLEFNQLNDELNQIADTDYNGVVCLNGGQMADGTKAVNGKFDYAKGDAVAPTKLGKGDVNVLGSDKWDDTGIANGAWKALNSAWTRQTGQPSTNGPESVDITFQFDKTTSSWKAITANNGANINNISCENTTNGGFNVQYDDGTGNKIDMANVVLDQTKVNNGDTITLTFNNPSTGIAAPTNATAKAMGDENFTAHDTSYEEANNLIVAIGSTPISEQKAYDAAVAAKGKADTDFSDAMAAAKAELVKRGTAQATVDAYTTVTELKNDANWAGAIDTATDVTAKETAVTTAAGNVTTAKTALDAAAATPVTSADMTEDVKKLFDELDNATFTATYGTAATVATDYKITLQDGTELTADGTNATEFVIGNTTFAMKTDAATGVVTIEDKAGTKTYFTIGAATNDDATALTATPPVYNSTGSISWDIGIDKFAYDSGAKPTVEVAKTGNVSKSNSYNQATAPLTYTDHIVLQAGARTKDSVDFTFEYTSGGLGNLKANMNCSARADGLGTDGLSLKNQKDANYAIDRIDNAINKVSMVRATFGAAQNRLEHKIDNMNVTKENLTSAESRIRDTNMAEEMSNFTRNQILSQASQSMLAQANSLPQSVLQLLG